MFHRCGVPIASFLIASISTACGVTQKDVSWPQGTQEVTSRRAFIRIPQEKVTPAFVREANWERDHKRDTTYAFGYVDRFALETLPFAVQKDIRELDAKLYGKFEFDAKTLALKEWPQTLTDVPYEEYHNYPALTHELQDIAAQYPALVDLESIGKTEEGRDIWALEVSGKKKNDPGLPQLLYVANMHGDEVVGRELMLYLSRHLTKAYGHDPRVTTLVDRARIFIIPSLNPDGFEKEQRYNAAEIDLNRNFPDFTADDRDEAEGRGIETQAMMAFQARHHFVLAANFHGGEVCFNMPWDTKENYRADQRFGDDLVMQKMAHQYADANRTMRANSGGSFERGVTYGYEWYEVNGGLQDWSIHYRASTHATIELSYAKWPPANQLPKFWAENLDSMLSYLENGLFGVHLHVQDAKGTPIEGATIRVASLPRSVTYPTAAIHRTALPGLQVVRVTAPGFVTVERTLEPWVFDGTYQTLVLNREPLSY